jgi:predicted nucleic acid-binding protein
MGPTLVKSGVVTLRVFIDSNILIYHFEANPDLGMSASARLAALHAAGDRVVVSDLVRLECRIGPLKSEDAKLLSRYDGFFSLPSVGVVALTAAVCDRAATIRARHGFRTPDALNLAAAIESECGVFLTHDARISRFPELRVEALS